jgi:hypothetical protein
MEMNHIYKGRNKITIKLYEIKSSFYPLLKSKYFYIGLFFLAFGIQLNYASQTYLHNYMAEGDTLPMLSDLILDHLPIIDLAIIYDIVGLLAVVIFVIYIIHKKEYSNIPYFLLICGIFLVIRGVFIVLTPFGNPPLFEGSKTIFNGFSKYELGVYPSGHAGNTFMFLLLTQNKTYRRLLLTCLIIIIITLFISHAHYSIDILSGILFAYAIRSYGDRYLTIFKIGKNSVSQQEM